MTGQGNAQRVTPLGTFQIEIRTVNNRGFKLVPRLGEALGRFEAPIERAVRERVRRGTVQLNAHWQRVDSAGAYRIQADVVAGYYRQLDALRVNLDADAGIDLSRLASLPGAVIERSSAIEDEDQVWEELSATLTDCLENLDAMRRVEGDSMQGQILGDLSEMETTLDAVQQRAPLVVDHYVDRLKNKIEAVLQREGMTVEPSELLREIHIFADRSDINEEITRLRSHFDLFRQTIHDGGGGRKLDFVIQEMFRETNTIGSKASDAEIARHVVDMKCALERIRELVQNIE